MGIFKKDHSDKSREKKEKVKAKNLRKSRKEKEKVQKTGNKSSR